MRLFTRVLPLAALLLPETATAQLTGDALRRTIDSIMNAPIAARRVIGASIAVVRGRDTIAIKGYGKANVELDVPSDPAMIYEIGSVTKQFTGAAIMQLVEQGKVSLDDDVTKYVAFNTAGRRVTLRRLLDHTSGIKGYTEMQSVRALMPLTLRRDTLLRLVEAVPGDFAPGEEQIYNNSAFFLAGLVIEKVTGISYDQYVQKHLFEPVGMKDAHYCSETQIRGRKTSGYDFDASGPIQKRPLSHVWPYAAGSLCMTARDLVSWNHVLHRTTTLMRADTYRQMITPDTLNDGYRVRYAKGLGLTPVLGHRALQHGGGINGWTSQNTYIPDESLSVVVLYNSSGPSSPGEAAEAIVRAVLGAVPPKAVAIAGDAARFVGSYAGRGRGLPQQVVIDVADGTLHVTRNGQKRALVHIGGDTFLLGSTRFIFGSQQGVVRTLRIDGGSANNVLSRR